MKSFMKKEGTNENVDKEKEGKGGKLIFFYLLPKTEIIVSDYALIFYSFFFLG